MTARFSKIELQGFRSFGHARQTIELPDSLAIFWGGNSQGKTSLVEALEFLLTGQIIRREMLASSKDEFTGALRNVHVDAALPVWVAGTVVCSDGETRTFTRTLLEDYRRGSATGCISRLEIDGQKCAEGDIETILGFRLSHPPLRAPVLSQHTLGYLFSITPSDRATYFRAILDTQDLEDFRGAVAALQPTLKAPALLELNDLAVMESIPALAATAAKLRKTKSEADLGKTLLVCSTALLASVEISPAADLIAQADQIDGELQRRRAQTFPLESFGRAQIGQWPGPTSAFIPTVKSYLTEKARVAAETRRLMELFNAALSLHVCPTYEHPTDCPLCGATETLTVERFAFIRRQVAATQSFTATVDAFLTVLRSLDGQLDALEQTLDRAKPKFMRDLGASRRLTGFTLSGIRQLIPDSDAISGWIPATRHLWRSLNNLQRISAIARQATQSAISEPEQCHDAQPMTSCLAAVAESYTQVQAALAAYEAPARAVGEAIKAVVDQSADTKGWETLIRVCRQPNALWTALQAASTHTAKVKSLEKTLAEIDTANGKVMDEKFLELSNGVRSWWDRLRPDETTFFDGIQRRSAKARRTIDLKVGMSAKDDRSDPKIRDAIAVFSQSQTHCLGLSLFLARAIEEGSKLVILDDPVLTSDNDYRPNFVSSVIEALLDIGLQVIICTQDHKSWKDMGDRWGHKGAAQFQIVRNDPILGSEIRSQNDDLATMMAQAQPATKSQDPAVRKEGASKLRMAIERFAKMVLVRECQRTGDSLASITDFDGKNFGTYSQRVMGLLTKDQSHPGKLKAAHAYVTPGPHDDKPPSAGELASAYGDLKKLKKDYIG